MQPLSGKIWQPQVQDNGLASSDDLHSIEVYWYDKKLYFGQLGNFTFSKMQRTESVIRHLLHNNCTPNYAWVTLSPSGQLQNDYTYSHYVFISLVILKNRTYLRPSLGHIWTRCAFVDNFEFATNKAFDVSIGMSMLFWLGSFLKSSR